jgi:hypothetical protein
MTKTLQDKRAQEHADRLRLAILEMLDRKRCLEALGYRVVIQDGTASVTRTKTEEL